MYQTVGHHAIDLYAEAMDLPLFRRTIEGSSKLTVNSYLPTEGDEVEDLYELLKDIKEKVKVDAVSCGAILSNYQRLRVENVSVSNLKKKKKFYNISIINFNSQLLEIGINVSYLSLATQSD